MRAGDVIHSGKDEYLDAGALLLGATERLAGCFNDCRPPDRIEHTLATLVSVFGLAHGYEDLNDNDELRHDPVMAVLTCRPKAQRPDCAPADGKSTLNGLELSRPLATHAVRDPG